MDVCAGKPFYVNIANFERVPIRLPKRMRIGIATHCVWSPREAVVPTPAEVMTIADELEEATPAKSETANDTKAWQDDVKIGEVHEDGREEIVRMLAPYAEMWDGHLGNIKAVKHRIDVTPGSAPVFGVPYRAGPKMRQYEKDEVDRMKAAGVIEPASTEWASPIVFVPKKDGELRFCIDYRKLNAMTVRDSYPIPRMDECIDSLGDATLFTTLDANSGYWQVEIDPADRDKTTFTSHFGLYRFLRMPFGLRNAPATFQRAMDVILASVRWQVALVYLDDVIIFSKSYRAHLEHVATVLSLLKSAGVTLKLAKCHFFSQEVDYLGHVIFPGKLAVSTKTCEAVERFRPLRTTTDVRSFLGLCNVFRRFMPNFARMSAPLNKKLEKGQPAKFDELNAEETKAFEDLKGLLIAPPVLALPKAEGKYTVDTDACDLQVGCVLLQEQEDGTNRPVGYWSRTLTKPEKAYTVTERECLAVVWAVLLLRPYLEGARFTVRTCLLYTSPSPRDKRQSRMPSSA